MDKNNHNNFSSEQIENGVFNLLSLFHQQLRTQKLRYKIGCPKYMNCVKKSSFTKRFISIRQGANGKISWK